MERYPRIASKLSLIISLIAVNFNSLSHAEVLRVCKTCEWKSIQQAIVRAPAHSTVQVETGEYFESNISITRPLKLIASTGKVVIDGQHRGNVIFVQADQVEISGFYIRNSGLSYTDDFAGIKVMNSSACTLRNNRLENNFFGIYLGRTQGCLVEKNNIVGLHKGEAETGNGIHIWYGKNMVISENTTSWNRDGIYFEFVTDSSISNNRSYQNYRYGLHFMFSHNDSYFDNTFESNGSGVAVMYSRRISMIGNKFISSLGPASYGILLKDISDSIISKNFIKNNTLGIFIEGTTRTKFQNNQFLSNGWALRLFGDSDTNTFISNDFLKNTFDVISNATMSLNIFDDNYWSHYRGVDLNHDHIGDDPYYPVQLSSMLIERYKVSSILMNSFLFQLLDEVERVLPVLTPAGVKDAKPRMLRVNNHD